MSEYKEKYPHGGFGWPWLGHHTARSPAEIEVFERRLDDSPHFVDNEGRRRVVSTICNKVNFAPAEIHHAYLGERLYDFHRKAGTTHSMVETLEEFVQHFVDGEYQLVEG